MKEYLLKVHPLILLVPQCEAPAVQCPQSRTCVPRAPSSNLQSILAWGRNTAGSIQQSRTNRIHVLGQNYLSPEFVLAIRTNLFPRWVQINGRKRVIPKYSGIIIKFAIWEQLTMIRAFCLSSALQRTAPIPLRNRSVQLPRLPAIFHPVKSSRNTLLQRNHTAAYTFPYCLFSLLVPHTPHLNSLPLELAQLLSKWITVQMVVSTKNSSKYLLIPKKQTWLNPPTTATSL